MVPLTTTKVVATLLPLTIASAAASAPHFRPLLLRLADGSARMKRKSTDSEEAAQMEEGSLEPAPNKRTCEGGSSSLSSQWQKLILQSPSELRLELSLPSGQSFRWSRCTGEEDQYAVSTLGTQGGPSALAHCRLSLTELAVDARDVWAGVIGQTAFFLHQGEEDPSILWFRYLPSVEGMHTLLDLFMALASSNATASLAGNSQQKETEANEKKAVLHDYFQLSMSMVAAWERHAFSRHARLRKTLP